jgi:hypothetical protein
MGVQQEFEELGRRFVEALTSGDLEGLMDFSPKMPSFFPAVSQLRKVAARYPTL